MLSFRQLKNLIDSILMISSDIKNESKPPGSFLTFFDDIWQKLKKALKKKNLNLAKECKFKCSTWEV